MTLQKNRLLQIRYLKVTLYHREISSPPESRNSNDIVRPASRKPPSRNLLNPQPYTLKPSLSEEAREIKGSIFRLQVIRTQKVFKAGYQGN